METAAKYCLRITETNVLGYNGLRQQTNKYLEEKKQELFELGFGQTIHPFTIKRMVIKTYAGI